MSKIYLKTNCLIFFVCIFFSQISAANVKKLNKKDEKKVLISMGLQNLPDIYYDHYLTFPSSIEEMCSFIENHYDFKNDSSEIWETTVKYLRKNKSKIRITTTSTMFIISEGKKISYNERNICALISNHYPENEYIVNRNDVAFFNSNNKNIKEINGIDFSDTLRTRFYSKIKEVLRNHKTEFLIFENKRYQNEPYDKILLEFSKTEGIQPFCKHEVINMLNEKYMQELKLLCTKFCNENNLNKIIFCSFIVL